MKFSIIIPVYNVEKYIGNCLQSVLEQTYDNYEVIVVNDGSPDNSSQIINKFVKKDKRFKEYVKENGGLSDARNYGVTKASGDVIVFLDGDDYIENKLLENLKLEFSKSKDIDVVRFQLLLVDEEHNPMSQPAYDVFSNLDSTKAYKILLKNVYVDPAWAYAYRADFFLKNKFEYAKGKINEDFGLTHWILINARNISSINYVGYCYVQRDNSIMSTKTRKQNLRKVYDTLYHFDKYIEWLNNNTSLNSKSKDLITQFITKAIIYRSSLLDKDDFNDYIKVLRKRKIYKLFPNDSFKDKLRRLFIKYNLKMYVRKNIGR